MAEEIEMINNDLFADNKSKHKKEIVNTLNDYSKPYMISFLTHRETDKINLIKIIGDRLQEYRKLKGFETSSILCNLITNNMIIRRSIKGQGSEQLVNIIREIVNDERMRLNPIGLQNNVMR